MERVLCPLSFRILERNDGGVFQIIYTGKPDARVSVTGTIVGPGSPREVLSQESKPIAPSRLTKTLVPLAILLTVITIAAVFLVNPLRRRLGKRSLLLRERIPALVMAGLNVLLLFAVLYLDHRSPASGPPDHLDRPVARALHPDRTRPGAATPLLTPHAAISVSQKFSLPQPRVHWVVVPILCLKGGKREQNHSTTGETLSCVFSHLVARHGTAWRDDLAYEPEGREFESLRAHHLQFISSVHSRLREFARDFCGVPNFGAIPALLPCARPDKDTAQVRVVGLKPN
jgi:hypothetical protein